MCREQLPVWQQFYEAHRDSNFEILAIAMDAQGPGVVRRFTEAAGVTFPAAVDRAQGLWELYGFDVVPNGYFVDENGILRYAKVGGFEVRNAEDSKAIKDLLAAPTEPRGGSSGPPSFSTLTESLRKAEEAVHSDPRNPDLRLTLGELQAEAKRHREARREFEAVLARNPESVRAIMGLAAVHLDLGEREKAARLLRKARALEPDNLIIRKQIWAVEHPEEFYPGINLEWQRQQIQKEKSDKPQ